MCRPKEFLRPCHAPRATYRLHEFWPLFVSACLFALLHSVANAADVAPQSLPETIRFNAHIRPILSNTCFTCHGPDTKANESGFLLDSFEHATAALPSDAALVGIVPGHPLQSEVYLRISDQSEFGELMPPASFRHDLTNRDKALIRRWIEQGAEYEQHWSYAPRSRGKPPQLTDPDDWISNPIDAYILRRLQEQGLKPSRPADKARLLRRLTLDLIGLPPTVPELNAFLADPSENAYQQTVERLLASPHFGERMAAYWLDLVRFADTVGFHGDQNQRIFPYRDYVIDAFNSNKPFDQFTREQLAGDLMPHPTEEQLVATGFLRLNMMTREGGAQPAEYLAKYRADRVRALGTVWLGSTLGCCECHNHKYDPFTARDFYSFGAFFDDLQQWGVYTEYGYTPNPDLRGFNNDFPFPPEIRVQSKSLRAEIHHLRRTRDELLCDELGAEVMESKSFRIWCTAMRDFVSGHPTGWSPLHVRLVNCANATAHQVLDDRSVLFQGAPQAGETMGITAGVADVILANALRVEILPHDEHKGFVGRGTDGRFAISDFALFLEDATPARSAPKSATQPVPTLPRYVRIELPGDDRQLSLAEVEIFTTDETGALKNIASSGKARQSSDHSGWKAARAIDGNRPGSAEESPSVSRTKRQRNPWWELDLRTARPLDSLTIWGSTADSQPSELEGAQLVLLDDARRRLHVTPFVSPDPSTQIHVPPEVEMPRETAIRIAWSEADRSNPQTYASGREPVRMEPVWRSGPAKWQLPKNESRLPHTAVLHFDRPYEIGPDSTLRLEFVSADIGRIRMALTPIGHATAGWDAVDADLAKALQASPDDRRDVFAAALVSTYHRSTTPITEQSATSRTFRDHILALRCGGTKSLVAQSLPADELPVSRVLPRGNWQDESGALAPPGFPDFLPGVPTRSDATSQRLTRLDLADWITCSENPLTARHFVNRTWKQFFAAGLSAKLDDLGNQGEWPSHPDLLDWLASEFVRSDWDMKRIVRLIVNSNTYRQAAAVRSDLGDIDPYNRLLAQQTARRLEAEIVRDNALSISGLLHTDYVGGPSIFPFQPAGHYRNIQFPNRKYLPNDDWRQYRRGVYMHWQRSFLHPMLVNFDAPRRDECTADRALSNSPQQALTLLNDPVFANAAAAMAADIYSTSETHEFATLLETAFLRALSRHPTHQELTALTKLHAKQLAHYQTESNEAAALLRSTRYKRATSPVADDIDKPQLAAFAQVCRVILNLHETMTRY